MFKLSRTVICISKHTGVILIIFGLYSLPSKLDVSWHAVKVWEYIPSPMSCKTCQLKGHTSNHCNNPASCVSCNLTSHLPEPCYLCKLLRRSYGLLFLMPTTLTRGSSFQLLNLSCCNGSNPTNNSKLKKKKKT